MNGNDVENEAGASENEVDEMSGWRDDNDVESTASEDGSY